jgi:hypothetical protein
MKKEFSFYEFVGLIVPGCLLLYGTNFIFKIITQKQYLDFDKVGETLVFLIICYGTGHLIQAVGNIFEKIIWSIYKGMPSSWLVTPNIFNETLFKEPYNQKVKDKVIQKYGVGLQDYTSLVYNQLYSTGKTGRIDIFNGNYSLFRGLAVTFLCLSILCCYYFDWKIAIPSFAPFILCTRRMMRFGKYYATETYTTFL